MRKSILFVALIFLAGGAHSQKSVTNPKDFFGFDIGDDYQLANYKQYDAYLHKLEKESNRIKVVSIGKTEEGREQYLTIVSAPENLRNAEKLRQTAKKLALGQVPLEAEARKLSQDGRAIVWIDGGLHATEVLGAQQLIATVYKLVSAEDPETQRIRKDVIVLLVHANPDGMDLVSDWYMRKSDPKARSMSQLPRLYEKYAGHDNNRDFYSCNLSESINMNRILYKEWFPQILYNHHQTGPAGSVIFAPPFRGPFNYHVDPLTQVQTDQVGMAMHARFVAEGKPGAVMRNAASYQTWWNGGLRTTAYFHNVVGILTEAIGSPTPMRIPTVPRMLVPTTDVPFPIEPQEWHFKQSIEYELTANWAILDFASRQRETLLFNMWRMARNEIEKAGKDTWTLYPSRVNANGSGVFSNLRRPELRDAKAYIISANQPDFPTAVKFANALIKNGVEIQRATREFTANGKTFPEGSLIVQCAQAYRAHVLDMFEPQDYPNDFQYPGGPPIAPYDSAGYTLAYTMDVQFERVLDPLTGPFEKVEGFAKVPTGTVMQKRSRQEALFFSCEANDAFTAACRLLKAGVKVFRKGGNFYFAENAESLSFAQKCAQELGVSFGEAQAMPDGLAEIRAPRVALLDRYGGSMESGWTRWILEQFQIPFTVLYPPDVDAGKLSGFQTLILVSGMSIGGGQGGGGIGEGKEEIDLSEIRIPKSEIQNAQQDPTIPEEWRARMGSLSVEKSLPQIKAFLEGGGTVVAIGSATSLARRLALPVGSALVETVDGQERNLPREKFYCPGSVLRVRVDNSLSAAFGMGEYADVMSDNSPAFRFLPGAEAAGIKRIAWFDSDKPLRSGWCWGQQYLKDAVAAYEAPVGQGRLLCFGPEILFRGQTHGTFKLLFNSIFR